ncbi:cell division control protein 11 [Trichomonascus vanleenenianus]|uniref:cell division control protein 11 n=1 Tax=Trichomonascus vanleenenianus TaxID=2268995 RepID=UPI003ECA10EE
MHSPFQMRRKKNTKKVTPFTMMVCGTSGTGRTSFVNTLCNGEEVLDSNESAFDARTAHEPRPVSIRSSTTEIEEDDGTRIALTVVDTPGFGDNINNEECFGTIVKYIETQYDEVLAEESRIRRNPRFKDNRVHVCIYFIEPTGHGLRELDIALMRQLGRRVNIIPVIGRSDQLTPSELSTAKKIIMEDIAHYQIPIYDFPYDAEEDDAETIQENSELKGMLPFAIVSGNEIIHLDGEPVRARTYPWGYVLVDNPEHSDFTSLRSALLGSHLADLKDMTHDFLYETYRTERLSSSVMESGGAGAVRDSRLLNPEDLANQSYLLKEEQLQREEEKLREIERRVQKEINEKRLELSAREAELREIEARIARDRASGSEMGSAPQSPYLNSERRPSDVSIASNQQFASPRAQSPLAQMTNQMENASLEDVISNNHSSTSINNARVAPPIKQEPDN